MAERIRGLPRRRVDLALAVNPVDALTGQPLRRRATVTVPGVHQPPPLNPSGYWLFLDPPVELPPEPVPVTVDPAPRYVARTVEVDTGERSTPGVRVDVYPSTAYPLPDGTTALQGTVEDGAGDPVAGATVGLEGTTLETRTGADGGFLLVVEGIVTTETAEPGDVLRVDPSSDPPDRVLAHPSHGPPEAPTVEVDHPDHTATTVDLDAPDEAISEGERTRLDAPIIL